MELMAPVEIDPSVFDTARLYVFGPSGDAIVEKDYPITLPPPASTPQAEPAKPSVGQPTGETVAAAVPEKATVAVADLVLTHDAGNKTLKARFRVKNMGDSSSPVAGRCVIVLKTAQADQGSWLTMPQVKMADGQPEGNRGRAFRISRFRDMEIKAREVADPSVYQSATIYVFDTSGMMLLEETVPVSFPAPPTPSPDSREEPSAAPLPPETASPPEASGEAPGSETIVQETPAVEPAEDPSLTDDASPAAGIDGRARF